jgi:hypothetical protein|tara:strand:+ start:713 stop:1594 length:882 start_codon:yes stop_codon:yes gene_type:complete
MKRIDVERKEINKKDYIRRTARLSDVSRHIKEDAIVYHNGKPILLYKVLSTPPKDVRWAVKNIKYSTGKRTHGLVNTSAVFGYSPRQENKHDYCTSSAMGYNTPKQHYIISNFAKQIQKYYKDYFQETYKQHKEKVKEKVKDQWVIKDTVFTSGIVNKNNQLKYHFDSGNFKNVYSNMLVFKSDVMGGHLVIPEIDISLEVADNSVTIFDGQDLLHGVSPIDYNNSKAYRYSIVYYSLERMWQCMTIEEEIDRIREKKMIREENRLKPEHLDTLRQRKKEAKDYKETIENEQK